MSARSQPRPAVRSGRLPVRAIRFEYPDDTNPAWSPRFPEFAAAVNSVSLLMPFAEPYFVRSVRSALPQLDDELRAQAETYLKQELQHHVQHRKFNSLVTQRYPKVVRVEGWMRRTYAWLSHTRSQKFNLAFAAASETIAYSLARWTDRHVDQLFIGADPVPTTLFLWHLAEEVEHKTSAYDVYEAIDGSRLRYALAMFVTFSLLAWFTTIATLTMLHQDHRAFYPVTYFRLFRWSMSFAFTLLPTMLASSLPGHHPSQFADPLWLSAWLRQYDPETGLMPVPSLLLE